MKLGLLADIHGNDLALSSVLTAARASAVEALLVAGDLVGYYHRPASVLALLDAWQCYAVRGNHEDMLTIARADASTLGASERKYGSALRTAIHELELSQLERLRTLPHPLNLELGGRRILLCHGAPWANDCYIYPDADVELLHRCAEGNHDLVVLGHTHYAMVRRVDATLVVNPGSVGQPRDRRPGAAWATYDTETGEVMLHRESYEAAPIIAEARARDAHLPYLAHVLCRK